MNANGETVESVGQTFDPTLVVKVEQYRGIVEGNAEATIMAGWPVDGRGEKLPDAEPRFFAEGRLQFDAGGGRKGEFGFVFKIDGKTVPEAFANFVAAFSFAKGEAEKKLNAERSKIVVAGGIPRGNPRTRFR